ncbi:MAG: hydrogenase nickel incorporation protein HypB [Kiritimatiellae bacterium]|nr:hydrogenase nickel incorporation protein HypB [Kiritimatiellia bacterium]
MCESCGCGETAGHWHDHGHEHGHEHTHVHGHDHGVAGGRIIPVRSNALALNQRLADQNRGWFRAKGWTVFNLLSSPGSGKTALLERTLAALDGSAALVGDLQTERDADRLRAAAGESRAVQITTGETCHLDAHMVAHALDRLPGDGVRWLFIENVGNLVCPASFDLGEKRRVVLLSVTEGEDKPLKYPVIFREADLVLVTKNDLAAAVEFDRAAAEANIRQVAPKAEILAVSSKTGEGMEDWLRWVRAQGE